MKVYIAIQEGNWDDDIQEVLGVFKQKKDAEDMVKSMHHGNCKVREYELIE